MMSWIIQIGLFSLLSLRQLIYAWVPRGRLQLSFLCLKPSLPVLGNKPAMIINQRQDFFSTKIEIQIMPDLPFYSSVLCFFNHSTWITDQELIQSPWLSLKLSESVAECLYHYSFLFMYPILHFMHLFFFLTSREPDSTWIPHDWYGPPAEGGWKNPHCHHAVCRQWKPRPRDLLVQRHASCGHRQQQRAHQTASLRYSLMALCWNSVLIWFELFRKLTKNQGGSCIRERD